MHSVSVSNVMNPKNSIEEYMRPHIYSESQLNKKSHSSTWTFCQQDDDDNIPKKITNLEIFSSGMNKWNIKDIKYKKNIP